MNLALACALATGVQVGAALVASQAVVAEVGTGWLGVLRYGLAVTFLLPLLLRRPGRPIARRHLLPLILLGIGQFGITIALLNLAVLYADAARVALVFATLPIVTLVIGRLMGQARQGALAGVGVGLTLLGVVCLLGLDALAGEVSPLEGLGLAASFGAAVSVAVCSLLYRPYVERYGVVRVSTLAMAAALIPLGLIAVFESPAAPPLAWGGATWALIVFVGASSGAGYLAWLYALEHLDAAKVTGFLSLSPITAATLSALFLDAPVTPGLVLAVAFVALGLVLLSRRTPHKQLV